MDATIILELSNGSIGIKNHASVGNERNKGNNYGD